MNGGRGPQDPNQTGWVFTPGGGRGAAPQNQPADYQPSVSSQPAPDPTTIEWTASEYIAHQKNAGWYFSLAGVSLLVAALVYVITQDVISTGFTLFAGFVVAVVAARKPRLLAYRLDAGGLTVGQKYYPFSRFKSFAVMQQGPIPVVMLMPLKRMLPSVDIYVPPENSQAVLSLLSNSLPVEAHNPRAIDSFAHRVRF